jgi:hypothetical protein
LSLKPGKTLSAAAMTLSRALRSHSSAAGEKFSELNMTADFKRAALLSMFFDI